MNAALTQHPGACACGHHDARHGAVDDVIERVRAGHLVEDVADAYGLPVYAVELIAIAAEYEEAPGE